MNQGKHTRFSVLFVLLLTFLLSCTVSAAAVGKVKGIKASVSVKEAVLTWPKIEGAAGYEVTRVNKAGKELSTVKVKSNVVRITKLKANTNYYFQVRAFNAVEKYGKYSAVVTVKPVSSVPSAPDYLELSTQNDRAVTLRWERITSGQGYIIEYLDDVSGEYITLKTMDGYSKHDIYITGLKANRDYIFRVRSFKKSGNQLILGKPSPTLKVRIWKLEGDIKDIRSAYYVGKIKASTTCTNMSTKKTMKIKKNTVVYLQSRASSTSRGFLTDGTPIRIAISKVNFTGLDSSPKNDYTKAAKEKYINLRMIPSNTSYLIWVSQAKVKVNVFKGTRGNWKLQKVFPCVVGAWNTRSTPGIHRIIKKIPNGSHNQTMWFTVGEAQGGTYDYPAGCAFHGQVGSAMSAAVSNGCIRLRSADLTWLYNNCPLGTCVYVY